MIKMKTPILMLSAMLLAIASSCKKQPNNVINIDTAVDILYTDTNNNNIFDSQSDGLSLNDITIYHVIDGKKQVVNNGNLTHPKGAYIHQYEETGENLFRIFPNAVNEKEAITLIQFGASDTDTIKCDFNKVNASTVLTKIWYNSELKWDVSTANSNALYGNLRFFQVIK